MKPGYNSILILFLLTLFGSIFVGELYSAQGDANDPGTPIVKPPREKPIIIWFHSGLVNKPETLKRALSSGLITHVLLLYTHRLDHNWKKSPAVLEAIDIVKKSGAKLIWSRNMWPYWSIRNSKTSDMLNPNYYINEIENLRAEGKEIGADFLCLDLEPYGNSPMEPYLLVSKKHIKLNNRQVLKLKSAVKEAIATVGNVDFILQAGWVYYIDHPFEIIAQLGDNRISECTYRVNEEVFKAIKYPYEIFGAHLNTLRECKGKSPYFLVSDIFEKSHLWSKKKGVFLYTLKDNSLPVAKALVAYAKTLPIKKAPPDQQ